MLPAPMHGADRSVCVRPQAKVEFGESVFLSFEDGERIDLQWTDDGWKGKLPEAFCDRRFKVRRDPGAVNESGWRGQGLPARTAAVLDAPLWIHPPAWQDRRPQAEHARVGRWKDHELSVPGASRPRPVRVHLPVAYDGDPNRRFPVLLALDGQNAVDAAMSFGGAEWCLDEAAGMLEAGGGAPFILVAVDNGGGRRIDEYTFCPGSVQGQSTGGQAEAHLDFLLEQVLPMVRASYRCDDKPPALMGSSLGGLFGLWAAQHRPEAFRAIAALSPSVWWAEKAVLRLMPAEGARPTLWIDTGTDEGTETVANFHACVARLKALGWKEGTDLRSLVVPEGVHQETAWADRANAILAFLAERLSRP